jgi:hypothetical protein
MKNGNAELAQGQAVAFAARADKIVNAADRPVKAAFRHGARDSRADESANAGY